jgi:two-component system heavy metal sensor histidine kinase CusS
MKRVSLTFRLSMMFVCAVVAVLVVAGFTFDAFSRHHFKALDRQAMTEKLESIRQIMDGEAGSVDSSDVVLQLQALLGAHQELSASIVAKGGRVIFATPNVAAQPAAAVHEAVEDMLEWTAGGHMYRAMKAQGKRLPNTSCTSPFGVDGRSKHPVEAIALFGFDGSLLPLCS